MNHNWASAYKNKAYKKLASSAKLISGAKHRTKTLVKFIKFAAGTRFLYV